MAPSIVVFTLDGFHLALEMPVAQRVVAAVEIAPLPDAPRGVQGVINLRGEIVPVFDLRLRLGLPPRELRTSDHFVIASASGRTVAVIADSVSGVVACAEAAVAAAPGILPGLDSVKGWIKLGGDLILIEDLEKFLSIDGQAALDAALER